MSRSSTFGFPPPAGGGSAETTTNPPAHGRLANACRRLKRGDSQAAPRQRPRGRRLRRSDALPEVGAAGFLLTPVVARRSNDDPRLRQSGLGSEAFNAGRD